MPKHSQSVYRRRKEICEKIIRTYCSAIVASRPNLCLDRSNRYEHNLMVGFWRWVFKVWITGMCAGGDMILKRAKDFSNGCREAVMH
jgi:hypothetical protein